MSEENLEIVSEWVEAFNRRDTDGFLAGLHPDVEWDDTEGFPGIRGLYRGRAGARKWWDEFLEAWEIFDAQVEQITEGNGGTVFLEINGKARGRSSGVETELELSFVIWVADHKITRRKLFSSKDEALEAAGLRE